MVHFLGNHKVVRLGPLRFWAERGLIHVEDGRDNSYETMPVRELLFRAQALNDMKMAFDGTESTKERKAIMEERARIQEIVTGVLGIASQAREQGSPDDPTADHARRKKRPSVCMPSTVDMEAIEGLFS